MAEIRYREKWNREETILAYDLFCKIPFSKISKTNKDIISLAELLGRQPLFPADNYLDELQKIISVLGSPSDSDLEFINDQKTKTTF